MENTHENDDIEAICKSPSSHEISEESPRNIFVEDGTDGPELNGQDNEQTDLNSTKIPTNQKSNTNKDDLTNASPKDIEIEEPMCHVNLDSILELRSSTKKLICLLQDIQIKTQIRKSLHANQQNEKTKPLPTSNAIPFISEIFQDDAAKIESETQVGFDALIKEDDCTVYKKLTRRCQCFNQQEYNDFVIKFNDTKYFTSTMGEIIKNMRILKKFLYMEGDFGRHALMFLNEALSDSTDEEKVDVAQGCAYADICNVFDDHSIVIYCISLLCKHSRFGDITTQALTASFLYKLAHLEEGLRYLNFSSKITTDLKKLLRKKAGQMESDTLESLNATLNILHPPLIQHTNAIYYCRTNDSTKSEKICKKCEYQSPYRYRRQITTKTYAAALQNITIKRPKIIPIYTE